MKKGLLAGVIFTVIILIIVVLFIMNMIVVDTDTQFEVSKIEQLSEKTKDFTDKVEIPEIVKKEEATTYIQITNDEKTTKEMQTSDIEKITTRKYMEKEDYIDMITKYTVNLMNEAFKTVDTPEKSFVWDTEKKKDTWRYFNGVMLDGFWRAEVQSENGDALEFLSRYYDVNVTSDGKVFRFGSDITLGKELDSIAAARPLFYLIGTDKWQDKYETVLNSIYTQLADSNVFTSYENCGGNLLHKPSWTDFHIGLDGTYMYMPFMMEYAKAIENGNIKNENADPQKIYKEIYERLMWISENMYDEKAGLLHHGWNAQTNQGNGHFWSRGIGWCVAAMADVIEIMPVEKYKNDLIKELKKLLDGILIYQDKETGMWYNVMNCDASLTSYNGNHLETSGTALVAYTLMKASNQGWLDEDYAKAGLKAFEGIVNYKMKDEFTITDIYKASGVLTNDAGYCKNSYVDNEGKGVGPVIMAMVEAKKQ